MALNFRPADITDAKILDRIEKECFSVDRLSTRRIKHWLKASNRIFLVVEDENDVLGYGLALLHRGTRLSRLYSLAITQRGRSLGIAQKLLEQIQSQSVENGRLFMRLEVASTNTPAIALYKKLGYRAFGTYTDYYEDHSDALRMQKRIRYIPKNLVEKSVPWYRQSTDFTCGPAALMMAMGGLGQQNYDLETELDIWREATTIFMTSGHGGCHPLGLAIAAHTRGHQSSVYINSNKTLFLDGVRNAHKKEILIQVDNHFKKKAETKNIDIRYQDFGQNDIEDWVQEGSAILILISTYRMDGKKSPHWVTVTGIDSECLYVHDPDLDDETQESIDCQNIPIAREDFNKMSAFGNTRLRTAVVLHKP